MLKKLVSILMLYSALAIMLAHNFIGHHHHEFGYSENSHHHGEGHQHGEEHHHDNDTDNGADSDDWTHLFSGIQHGAEGLTFLKSQNTINSLSKHIPQFTVLHTSNFIFQQVIIEVRQNAPPNAPVYYNSQIFLPCGLRAPPISIV